MIEFRSTVLTRGIETTIVEDNTAFGTSAWYADANGTYTGQDPVFHNKEVTRNGDSYSYDNPVYWPTEPGIYIRFFGWYPYQSIKNITDKGVIPPAIDFQVNNDIPAQTDLLYGVTDPLNRQTGNPVRFTFKHALTRIRFAIKLADDVPEGYKVDVHNVYLSGHDKGTMSFPSLPEELPQWSTDETSWTYYCLEDGNGLTDNNNITTPAQGITRTATNITAEGYDLFLIPQKMEPLIPDWDTSSSIHGNGIRIEYTLKNDKDEHDPDYRYIENTVEISLADQKAWTPGAGITYTLVIGPRNTSVVLHTGEWKDGNAGNENIDFE